MKKTESSLVLLLDLVARRGCEVTFHPGLDNPLGVYINIRHQGKQIINGVRVPHYSSAAQIEADCCQAIERMAVELLGKDYCQLTHRNIEEE